MNAANREREAGRGHHRQVLVAVDESEASERVVTFVNEFFAGLDVGIIGVNVGNELALWMPDGPGGGASFAWPYMGNIGVPTEDDYVEHREVAAHRVEASGLVDDEVVAELGDPVVHICAVAAERDVDLVVVGDNHKSGWRRLLEGSVTSEVQRRAPCPVLIVP